MNAKRRILFQLCNSLKATAGSVLGHWGLED